MVLYGLTKNCGCDKSLKKGVFFRLSPTLRTYLHLLCESVRGLLLSLYNLSLNVTMCDNFQSDFIVIIFEVKAKKSI